MKEKFDDIIREFIDITNNQVGVYMDAIGGFAGHRTRTERQVFRINRPTSVSKDNSGIDTVVWASYEDPTQPDVIHNRIIRASDYIRTNSPGGSNEQQLSQAVIIFLYTFWESEIRPRLATSIGVELNEIRSDIMGDLRVLRNVILHSKGIMRSDKYNDLKKIKDMFAIDQPIQISYEDMHQIFVKVKQDCARMLYEWLEVEDAPVQPEEMQDIAIHKLGGSSPKKQ